jgi:hypothetical protein
MVRFYTALTDSVLGQGVGRAVFGGCPPTAWAAEITGRDPRYRYARKFLSYKKDYSEANSKGSRGVYAIYILDDGKIYEVKDFKDRYFCIVQDWEIVQVSREYVEYWLDKEGESEKTLSGN